MWLQACHDNGHAIVAKLGSNRVLISFGERLPNMEGQIRWTWPLIQFKRSHHIRERGEKLILSLFNIVQNKFDSQFIEHCSKQIWFWVHSTFFKTNLILSSLDIVQNKFDSGFIQHYSKNILIGRCVVITRSCFPTFGPWPLAGLRLLSPCRAWTIFTSSLWHGTGSFVVTSYWMLLTSYFLLDRIFC